MKNAILPICLVLFLFACKDEVKESHPAAHLSTISFDVSNSTNITTFNIYNNDDLIGQLQGFAADNSTYSFADSIHQHPYNLNYTIEPMFMDSASAKTDISMKISVDGQEVATGAKSNILFGEVAELAYSGE